MTILPSARTFKWVRVRLYITATVMTALFGVIGYKAWTVQIRDGSRLKALGLAQYSNQMEIPAPRGTIHDRNGVELAISALADSVKANPREVVDVAGTAQKLARALNMDIREVEAKLAANRYFAWIKRRVSAEEARRVEALKLAGIGIIGEPRRYYPASALAGPVLGFSDIDGKGIEGVELALDDLLRGQRLSLPALRDARGDLVLASGRDLPPTNGASITLTIDRFLQFTAERALSDAVTEHHAKAGVVLVMAPESGAILALASYPTFDPNHPETRKDARNRAVTDVFEAGSVMKAFSIAAAVDAGVVGPGDKIAIDGGKIQIGPKTISDTHKGENILTVSEVMKYSSNVGAVKIARKLGKERLYETLRRFGFGALTGVDLPGERTGVVRQAKSWGEIGLATIAFGYGLTVTPVQLAAALSAIANGGILYRPHVLYEAISADGRVLVSHNQPEGRRILSTETSRAVVGMLKTVLEKGGTGEKVAIPGYVGAGKTGTANKLDLVTHRYAADRYLASFMGFVPAENPRLVIVAMIDEPSAGKHYGGSVAGPVFTRVAEESLKYLGVPGQPLATNAGPTPEDESALAAEAEESVPMPVDEGSSGEDQLPDDGSGIIMIPDFTGMSMPQAIDAAARVGVKIELEGTGRAQSQFPGPGRARKSIACRVTFAPG